MILVSIWSANMKGEGRVSRDQKVGDDGNKRNRTLREHRFDGHTAAQEIPVMAHVVGRTSTCNRSRQYHNLGNVLPDFAFTCAP
jgi:hypothetical protein